MSLAALGVLCAEGPGDGCLELSWKESACSKNGKEPSADFVARNPRRGERGFNYSRLQLLGAPTETCACRAVETFLSVSLGQMFSFRRGAGRDRCSSGDLAAAFDIASGNRSDGLFSGCEGSGAMIGGDIDTFGANDVDLGDAEQGENRAQIGLDEIGFRPMEAATCIGDNHPPAPGKALRPSVRGVTEGFARNHDGINPGLEPRRYAEIIHRCAKNDGVGSKELVHRRGSVQFGRFDRKVAVEDPVVGVRRQCGDNGGGEVAGDRALCLNAGIDMQDGHRPGSFAVAAAMAVAAEQN